MPDQNSKHLTRRGRTSARRGTALLVHSRPSAGEGVIAAYSGRAVRSRFKSAAPIRVGAAVSGRRSAQPISRLHTMRARGAVLLTTELKTRLTEIPCPSMDTTLAGYSIRQPSMRLGIGTGDVTDERAGFADGDVGDRTTHTARTSCETERVNRCNPTPEHGLPVTTTRGIFPRTVAGSRRSRAIEKLARPVEVRSPSLLTRRPTLHPSWPS